MEDSAWHCEQPDAEPVHTGSPCQPTSTTASWSRCPKAGEVEATSQIGDHRPTLLLERNVPLKVVSGRLGHTMIAMTMDIYAHTLPAMDRDAASRFDAAVHGTTAP